MMTSLRHFSKIFLVSGPSSLSDFITWFILGKRICHQLSQFYHLSHFQKYSKAIFKFFKFHKISRFFNLFITQKYGQTVPVQLWVMRIVIFRWLHNPRKTGVNLFISDDNHLFTIIHDWRKIINNMMVAS